MVRPALPHREHGGSVNGALENGLARDKKSLSGNPFFFSSNVQKNAKISCFFAGAMLIDISQVNVHSKVSSSGSLFFMDFLWRR
jgi:hypothetical protein